MIASAQFHRPLLLALALVITACAANRASTFIPAPQDADNRSVLYLYRPSATANFMFSPEVVIDDEVRFKMGSGDYRYVYLAPGQYHVGLNPTDQYTTDAAITLRVEDGKSYYLRIKTSLQFETEKMNTRKFWIDEVDEASALGEIADTEFAGPKPQQSSAVQQDQEQGFSVDKTADPFAGKYQ